MSWGRLPGGVWRSRMAELNRWWSKDTSSGVPRVVDAWAKDPEVVEFLLWQAGFKPVND